MTKFKEGRYTYYIIPEQKLVKCVSSYAKKTVVGYAKCAADDEWNENIGMHIARVRCDDKINRKRLKCVKRDLDIVFRELVYWQKKHAVLCTLLKKAEKEKRDLTFDKVRIGEY